MDGTSTGMYPVASLVFGGVEHSALIVAEKDTFFLGQLMIGRTRFV
jgi:hypothetical protein